MYVYLRDPKTIECCGRVEWHTKSRQLHGADHPSAPHPSVGAWYARVFLLPVPRARDSVHNCVKLDIYLPSGYIFACGELLFAAKLTNS